MPRLTKLKVLSQDITVVELDEFPDDPENQIGSAMYSQSEIHVLKGMSLDAYRLTLMHEVTHIIETSLSLKFSEQTVDSIAVGFHSLLKDNPKFVRLFTTKGTT